MSNIIRINTALVKADASIKVANRLLSLNNDFSELIPYRKKNKWGFCTLDKKIVIDCVYENAKPFNKDGFAEVEFNGKSIYINRKGQQVQHHKKRIKWSEVWGEIYFDMEFPEGLGPEEQNGKIGFKDKAGKLIIPCIYDGGCDFSEGLAYVQLNNKWGYIDKVGKVVIPFIYDRARNFNDGFASVSLNDKWGFIDKTGKVVIPFVYSWAVDFRGGMASVRLNGRWGFIDKNGALIIPFIYDGEGSFYNNSPIGQVILNGKIGFINKQGKVVIPCTYEDYYNDENEVWVKLNNKWGCYEKDGQVRNDKITDQLGII